MKVSSHISALSFRGISVSRYSLDHDISMIKLMVRQEAPEAAVFYCARTLEMLICSAVILLGETPRRSVLSNLVQLKEYNLLPGAILNWAHALRRLGNTARHSLGEITIQEAESAVYMLEHLLAWYFKEYVFRDPDLSNEFPEHGLRIIPPSRFSEFINNVTMLNHSDNIPSAWFEKNTLSLVSPALSSVIAQMLLDRGLFAQAEQFLNEAMQRFPGDLRLRQFMGLLYSRRMGKGDLDRALEILLPLYRIYREDEDSYGILGGVYKRKWYLENGRADFLQKSHEIYLEGWKHTRKASTYLGVNAAATALWLEEFKCSRLISRKVVELIKHRNRLLSSKFGDTTEHLSFWDRITLAESLLLSGELAQAFQAYSELSYKETENPDLVKIGIDQAGRDLIALGGGYLISDVFSLRSVPNAENSLALGITGHRNLGDKEKLRKILMKELECISNKMGDKSIHVVTPLAEGADRLFAATVFEVFKQVFLEVILPLEIADYCQDFTSDESRFEFSELLQKACRIKFATDSIGSVDSLQYRDRAYMECGKMVVDSCSVLFALWDGEKASGLGGTQEVVDYARSKSKPVIWFNTNTFKTNRENL